VSHVLSLELRHITVKVYGGHSRKGPNSLASQNRGSQPTHIFNHKTTSKFGLRGQIIYPLETETFSLHTGSTTKQLQNLVKEVESSNLSEPTPLAYTHDQSQTTQNLIQEAKSSSLTKALAYTHSQAQTTSKYGVRGRIL
jgi:hypothetical protein